MSNQLAIYGKSHIFKGNTAKIWQYLKDDVIFLLIINLFIAAIIFYRDREWSYEAFFFNNLFFIVLLISNCIRFLETFFQRININHQSIQFNGFIENYIPVYRFGTYLRKQRIPRKIAWHEVTAIYKVHNLFIHTETKKQKNQSEFLIFQLTGKREFILKIKENNKISK